VSEADIQAVQHLLLWPASAGAQPSVQQWHEAVSRGESTGWIRLRGTAESAISGLRNLAVPQLRIEDLRRGLALPADEAPVVQRVGELRIVTARIPTLCKTAEDELQLELHAVRIVAAKRWVITTGAVGAGQGADVVERVLETVDLEVSAGSHPSGCDLGLRILLALAESCGAAANEAAHELDRADGSTQLETLQEVLDRLERSVATLRRRGRPTDTAWLPADAEVQTAEGIAEILDEALERLRAAKEEAIRREARLRADAERRRADALQLFLGTIAAVLLGPSLVAGIFAAFPGWQPVDKRGDSFIGLALASSGLLWLVAYAIPILFTRPGRRRWTMVAAVGVGVVSLAIGLVVALPMRTGLDDQRPEISVRCPTRPVGLNSETLAVVAASDPEGNLLTDPSGLHRLPTKRAGAITSRFRAVDSFGRAATASCTYEVRPMTVPRPATR
jgi:hypothetical protein